MDSTHSKGKTADTPGPAGGLGDQILTPFRTWVRQAVEAQSSAQAVVLHFLPGFWALGQKDGRKAPAPIQEQSQGMTYSLCLCTKQEEKRRAHLPGQARPRPSLQGLRLCQGRHTDRLGQELQPRAVWGWCPAWRLGTPRQGTEIKRCHVPLAGEWEKRTNSGQDPERSNTYLAYCVVPPIPLTPAWSSVHLSQAPLWMATCQ